MKKKEASPNHKKAKRLPSHNEHRCRRHFAKYLSSYLQKLVAFQNKVLSGN